MTSLPENDSPECPVCLEIYNSDDTIPRVLPCGHSTCEACLSNLSSSSISQAIRCPQCTHLVKLPHHLPKNIDLLRFSPSFPQPHNNYKRKKTVVESSIARHRFPPRLWSDEVYSAWKDWVLPQSVVLIDENKEGRIGIDCSGSSSIVGSRLVENQLVGLFEIGIFEVEEYLMECGYVGKVMSVLSCMSDIVRSELDKLVRVSLRNTRVCKILGLWLDVKSGCLYLVSERKNDALVNLPNLQCGVGEKIDDWLCCMMGIGKELCEVLVGLRSQGLVCGCLSLSCLDLDEFGHVYVDLGEVLVVGRTIRECISEGMNGVNKIDSSKVEEIVVNVSNMDVFVAPEIMLELLHRVGIEVENSDKDCSFDYGCDVWLLACVLVRFLIGKQFLKGMYNYMRVIFERKNDAFSEWKIMYLEWLETFNGTLLETLVGGSFSSMHDILVKCLDVDPGNRPVVSDVWKSIGGLTAFRYMARFSGASVRENVGLCLLLGQLCDILDDSKKESRISDLNDEQDDCAAHRQVGEVRVDDVVEQLCLGKVRCKDLQGHLDCITGLCVGGGFLFSSSLDKTVKVWSLQDFTYVHTFRGHEHRVMAVIFVNEEKPLCISADSEGGIFTWEVMVPFSQEPLKKWYEEKDWRYSGIHALAISDFGCLYTGSGDKLIKAWSLKDQTLLCSMEGHRSVVSSLALCNGVLYSGSWDGTVRLWSLHDHSPLAVFGEDMPGMMSSVLSLHADLSLVIAAHENGHIKIWMNDVLKSSCKVHGGAIFALANEERWMFTGGWDKTVRFQEIKTDGFEIDIREGGSITCDSVITSLLYKGGILFIGFANRLIKVYHCG